MCLWNFNKYLSKSVGIYVGDVNVDVGDLEKSIFHVFIETMIYIKFVKLLLFLKYKLETRLCSLLVNPWSDYPKEYESAKK